MKLVIDVGNTSTTLGLYGKGRILQSLRCPTSELPKNVINLIKKVNTYPITHAGIASVVPKMTHKIANSIKRLKSIKVWVVGQNLKPRIKHKYNNINKLGSDRLANIYGGVRLYGAPLLIFDFGTAVTCDYISANGTFEGGLIIPGPSIAFEALGKKTALLPQLNFPTKAPKALVARDTISGMKAGIFQGYAAMTDGLIQRFKKQYGSRLRTLATGGFAATLAHHSHLIDVVDPLLTLEGLGLVLDDQKIS